MTPLIVSDDQSVGERTDRTVTLSDGQVQADLLDRRDVQV